MILGEICEQQIGHSFFVYDAAFPTHRVRQGGAPRRRELLPFQCFAFRCREIVVNAHAPRLRSVANDDRARDFDSLAVQVAVILQPRARSHKLSQEDFYRCGGLAVDADQRCALASELASSQRDNGRIFADEDCSTSEGLVMVERITHEPAQGDVQGFTGQRCRAQQSGKCRITIGW